MATCYTRFIIRPYRRTSHAPWKSGPVEVRKINLGTRLRIFVRDTPEKLSIQANFFAHAQNTKPLSQLHVLPYEVVFHTQTCILVNF